MIAAKYLEVYEILKSEDIEQSIELPFEDWIASFHTWTAVAGKIFINQSPFVS